MPYTIKVEIETLKAIDALSLPLIGEVGQGSRTLYFALLISQKIRKGEIVIKIVEFSFLFKFSGCKLCLEHSLKDFQNLLPS